MKSSRLINCVPCKPKSKQHGKNANKRNKVEADLRRDRKTNELGGGNILEITSLLKAVKKGARASVGVCVCFACADMKLLCAFLAGKINLQINFLQG